MNPAKDRRFSSLALDSREMLTMVSVYFKSGQLPVRFPIYIAIVALARYVLDMNLDAWHMVSVAAAVLLLVIRYGHLRYAYDKPARDPSPPNPL